jgi:hypothetical protein
MSKITPKNLSYDDTLPPFLQRLRANNNALDGRNEFQSARPKKARNPGDEAEDEPVYFDEESGETLTKKEWEAKENSEVAGDAGEDGVSGTGMGDDGEKKAGEKEKVAAIGVSKKRKAGKVVGGEEYDEKDNIVGGDKEVSKPENSEKSEGKKSEKRKIGGAKKGKKIKLSFGDDE